MSVDAIRRIAVASAFVFVILLFAFVSCDKKDGSRNGGSASAAAQSHNDDVASTEARIAMEYFSATGNTRKAAGNLAVALGARIFEILPSKAYSDADLDYNNPTSRFSIEYKDRNARPGISNDLSEILGSDIIVLGYPIWGDRAPKIIRSLLDEYDLWSKRIYLFCTSGSSLIKNSMEELRSEYPGLDIVEGIRLDPNDEKAAEGWAKNIRKTR